MAMNVSDEAEVLAFLTEAEIEILGLLPYASNATLLTRASAGDREALAVYKPRRGERPLWDFPSGTLCLREFAAWVVSCQLGWHLVPPTVLRDGPAGFGALQLYIEEDEEADVRQLLRTHPEDLRRVALFDVVINNADRKAGHLIIDTAGRLWGVDHGVSFAVEPKLRTVIWAFEGETIAREHLADLEAFESEGMRAPDLVDVLAPSELDAMCRRISKILRTKRFPAPDPNRHHVPWPPW
jgi:hypothetical protein